MQLSNESSSLFHWTVPATTVWKSQDVFITTEHTKSLAYMLMDVNQKRQWLLGPHCKNQNILLLLQGYWLIVHWERQMAQDFVERPRHQPRQEIEEVSLLASNMLVFHLQFQIMAPVAVLWVTYCTPRLTWPMSFPLDEHCPNCWRNWSNSLRINSMTVFMRAQTNLNRFSCSGMITQ